MGVEKPGKTKDVARQRERTLKLRFGRFVVGCPIWELSRESLSGRQDVSETPLQSVVSSTGS